ncbi:MAG: hypothetical protein IKE75_04780 [Bacilli bacterium]|nr:hypothetical protein [Bacilli bacterium]
MKNNKELKTLYEENNNIYEILEKMYEKLNKYLSCLNSTSIVNDLDQFTEIISYQELNKEETKLFDIIDDLIKENLIGKKNIPDLVRQYFFDNWTFDNYHMFPDCKYISGELDLILSEECSDDED